jgi:hypothetical protein
MIELCRLNFAKAIDPVSDPMNHTRSSTAMRRTSLDMTLPWWMGALCMSWPMASVGCRGTGLILGIPVPAYVQAMCLIGLAMVRANACLSTLGAQYARTVRHCTCTVASDNALATSTIVLDRVSLPNPLSCPDCFCTYMRQMKTLYPVPLTVVPLRCSQVQLMHPCDLMMTATPCGFRTSKWYHPPSQPTPAVVFNAKSEVLLRLLLERTAELYVAEAAGCGEMG